MDSRVQLTFLVLLAVSGAVPLGKPRVSQPQPPSSTPENVLSRGGSIGVEASRMEVLKLAYRQRETNGSAKLRAKLSDPANHLVVWEHTRVCPEDTNGVCNSGATAYVRNTFHIDDERLTCVQLTVDSDGRKFHACVLAKTRD